MVHKHEVVGLGMVLGYLLPSIERHSRAQAALDALEQSLAGGFDDYRRAIAAPSSSSSSHRSLLQHLRCAQASLRVLSGDLEVGGRHLITEATDAARLLDAIYLYHSLIDMAAGVVDFQPDERFSLTATDAINAFAEARDGRLLVLGKLFEACGRYGCRLLEAEWDISQRGLRSETEAQRAVAGAYYQSCCRTLTSLLGCEAAVDERWAESARRLASAFAPC